MALKKQKGQRIEQRTLRTKLVREGFDLKETSIAFSECALFYVHVIAADPSVVDDSSNLYSYYEKEYSGDIPSILRRAALKKASGIYKSWRSNYENWKKKEDKRLEHLAKIVAGNNRLKPKKPTKPPVLPTELNLHPSYYTGAFKEDTGHSVVLKIKVGKVWKYVKFFYESAPHIEGWFKSTGSLVIKNDGSAWFNWVYERYQPATGGLIEVMKDGNRFVSVDLDLDGEIVKMAAYDVNADGVCTELANSTSEGHAKHTSRRKQRLGKIAIKMNQTGKISKGFAKQHWDKITRCEREAAKQISSQIVKFAKLHGCAAIVFEHLGNLKPAKGKFSRRSNQKRAYWLKAAVYKETERKARQNENILTARVNPRDTSNTEALSGEKVKRTNRMRVAEFWKANTDLLEKARYHPGSNAVSQSGKIINSGFNACRRIALKFAVRYTKKAQIAIAGCVGVVYQAPAKVASTLA